MTPTSAIGAGGELERRRVKLDQEAPELRRVHPELVAAWLRERGYRVHRGSREPRIAPKIPVHPKVAAGAAGGITFGPVIIAACNAAGFPIDPNLAAALGALLGAAIGGVWPTDRRAGG